MLAGVEEQRVEIVAREERGHGCELDVRRQSLVDRGGEDDGKHASAEVGRRLSAEGLARGVVPEPAFQVRGVDVEGGDVGGRDRLAVDEHTREVDSRVEREAEVLTGSDVDRRQRVCRQREVVGGDDEVELERRSAVALLVRGVEDEREDVGPSEVLRRGSDAVKGNGALVELDPAGERRAVELAGSIVEAVLGGEGVVVEADAEGPLGRDTERRPGTTERGRVGDDKDGGEGRVLGVELLLDGYMQLGRGVGRDAEDRRRRRRVRGLGITRRDSDLGRAFVIGRWRAREGERIGIEREPARQGRGRVHETGVRVRDERVGLEGPRVTSVDACNRRQLVVQGVRDRDGGGCARDKGRGRERVKNEEHSDGANGRHWHATAVDQRPHCRKTERGATEEAERRRSQRARFVFWLCKTARTTTNEHKFKPQSRQRAPSQYLTFPTWTYACLLWLLSANTVVCVT